MKHYLFPLTAVLITASTSTLAETAYVIDKLLVGVHQEEDLGSAIVKVLPTGTKLEVLVRKGEIAQIKDPDGITGWVDSAYLMQSAPAADLLEQLKLDKQALAGRIKVLEASAATPGGAPGIVDALTNENTELKSQLSAQKLKNSEIEAALSEFRKSASSSPGSGTVAAELREANLKLKQELQQTQDALDQLRTEQTDASVIENARLTIGRVSSKVLVGLGILLIASFAGGIYLMDYLSRRRHGGFRV